jgi:ABC-2 type transport system permease protein
MIGRIGRLTAGEFIKLFAQPFLYIALGMIVLSVVGAEVVKPLFKGLHLTVWKGFNSIQLFAYGFDFGLKISTYVLLIFSSMMFSGEFDRGTIKNLLTRPITRLEFFVSKCVTVGGLAALLYGFTFFVSAALALGMGDLGPVWDDSQYFIHRSAQEMTGHAWKAVGMTFLSFLAAGFLGVLVSNLTESSGYAVAIGLVLFLVADLGNEWLVDRAQQKMFMYYPSYALGKLAQLGEGTTTRWRPDIDQGRLYLVVPAAYIAVFIPLAFGIFRSRNITA